MHLVGITEFLISHTLTRLSAIVAPRAILRA